MGIIQRDNLGKGITYLEPEKSKQNIMKTKLRGHNNLEPEKSKTKLRGHKNIYTTNLTTLCLY